MRKVLHTFLLIISWSYHVPSLDAFLMTRDLRSTLYCLNITLPFGESFEISDQSSDSSYSELGQHQDLTQYSFNFTLAVKDNNNHGI